MSKFDFKLGEKYHVKGFDKPVILHSFRMSDNSAKVIVDGSVKHIFIDDILGPVIDGFLILLGKWIKSLFKK